MLVGKWWLIVIVMVWNCGSSSDWCYYGLWVIVVKLSRNIISVISSMLWVKLNSMFSV